MLFFPEIEFEERHNVNGNHLVGQSTVRLSDNDQPIVNMHHLFYGWSCIHLYAFCTVQDLIKRGILANHWCVSRSSCLLEPKMAIFSCMESPGSLVEVIIMFSFSGYFVSSSILRILNIIFLPLLRKWQRLLRSNKYFSKKAIMQLAVVPEYSILVALKEGMVSPDIPNICSWSLSLGLGLGLAWSQSTQSWWNSKRRWWFLTRLIFGLGPWVLNLGRTQRGDGGSWK